MSDSSQLEPSSLGALDPTVNLAPTPASARDTSSPRVLAVGTRLGPYRITGHLGRGGMGEVYRAHDDGLDRDVALKTIVQSLDHDEQFLRRFRAEAQAAAKISHPNLVQVYFWGEERETTFFAMELVEGRSLGDYLQSHGSMPWADAVRCAIQAARGLEAASVRGVIHRDVKPENLLLSAEGIVKVADFGLAKRVLDAGQTAAGVIVGTPRYMSPEQAQGETLDFRSDIYSLGATLFHLVAGRPVFDGSSAMKVCLRHIQEPPPDLATVAPGAPGGLARVVARTLAKRREQRPESYGVLIAELEAILAGAREDANLPVCCTPGGVRPARQESSVVAETSFSSGGDSDSEMLMPGAARAKGPTPRPGALAPVVASPVNAMALSPPVGTPAPGASTPSRPPLLQVVKRADGALELDVNPPIVCPTERSPIHPTAREARIKAPLAPRWRRLCADAADVSHLVIIFSVLALIPWNVGWIWHTFIAGGIALIAAYILSYTGGTMGERLFEVRAISRTGDHLPHIALSVGWAAGKFAPFALTVFILARNEMIQLIGLTRLWLACEALAFVALLEIGLAVGTRRSLRDRIFKTRVIDAQGLPADDGTPA